MNDLGDVNVDWSDDLPANAFSDARRRLLPTDLGYTGHSIDPPTAPNAVARRIIADLRKKTGTHLTHWRNMWLVYAPETHGRYEPTDEMSIVSDMVRTVLDGATYDGVDRRGEPVVKDWSPTKARVNEVTAAVESYTRVPAGTPSGTWLDERASTGDGEASQVIVCRNGLLSVADRQLTPHTPRFFSTTAVNVRYDANADEPVHWNTFMSQLWPGDTCAVETLEEWFGYVLSGDTSLHKIMLVVGPPRGGKGTIAWVLEQLLGGAAEVDHPSLRRLAEPFGLEPMLGKSAAIVGDARIAGDTRHLVEILLNISGEDPVSVNRKNKAELNVRLGTRFTVMSNEPPDLRDDSGAMVNRFVPLMLTQTFLGREDLTLKQKLRGELPGILNRALDGLDRLRERGGFTLPESSRRMLTDLEELSSPVRQFVNAHYVVDPERHVATDEMFARWQMWAARHGHVPGGSATFGKKLRAAFPGVEKVKRGPKGAQINVYAGVGPLVLVDQSIPV